MISSVLIISLFLVGYAGLHSLLASRMVKDWARATFGPGTDRWYRLAYNVVAVVTLLPLFPMLALLPDRTLYVVPAPWRWGLVGLQLGAAGAIVWSVMQTGAAYFLGLSQLTAPNPADEGKLVVEGLYRRVRHPLYFFSIIFLWLSPVMTVNWLTTIILFTLYFYVGSIHEERRLIATFGAQYERYRQQVPRLFPVPGRVYSQTQHEKKKPTP